MNRRDFLAASASTIASGGLCPRLAYSQKDKAMLPVVDTHQHLWNLDQLKLAWFDQGRAAKTD